MATGHHHQCHCHSTHLPPPPPPATTCYCTTCSTTTLYSSQPPPPPPFHSISPHVHHQHHHHQPPQSHLHAPPQNHHHNHHHPPEIHRNHRIFQKYRQQEDAEEETSPADPTVSSLIHRIAALESSLRLRRSKGSHRPSSLRHAAARTIQNHFRAFLVRRSVTLRNLKDLACIKSSLNELKSAISDKIRFDSELLSRESMNLLIKLDSIQGSDPMIRDGKRSISRELIRFMEFIDEMSTENHVISVKNVRFSKTGKKSVILQREQKNRASGSRVLGDDDDDVRKSPQVSNNQSKTKARVSSVPKLEEAIEKLELEKLELENLRKNGVSQNRFGGLTKNQPNAKKTVRFSENGNVYRLIKSSHGHGESEGSDSSNGGEEEEEVEEVEEIGVSSKETEVEDEDSSEMSENEMDPRKNLGTRMNQSTKNHQSDQEHNEGDEDDDEEDEGDDGFVFSAPLPEKMEYRVDSSKKMIGKR